MSYKDWYTVNKDNNDFIVVAVDKDLEFQKQYKISCDTSRPDQAGMCECFAGHTWCRHKKILTLFQKKNLIGSRTYYNFDKEKWLHAPKQEV